ncbi:cell death-inducing p53-target protein 1-like [Sparus aurata]|uniref:cell death-inducing p53-target protein 1-like n=1 Tax=Sparus aurata TaxID=8175 RepID=UPI0011C1A158|nr:cell death-inducing p53-target protein 1-like [Sparus aurata]XP_030263086.1 cell death-inducing p53-target protein 1-like [Sparus aurata]
MTSSGSELKEIVKELKHLSLKRQQLLERRKIQCIFQELRLRAEFGQTDEVASNQPEIDNIDQQLKQLTERKDELQQSYENILSAKDKKDKKGVDLTFNETIASGPLPGSNIFFVEPPPAFPAPTVILDLDKLPAAPSKTQCPECKEFIVTETFTSVSSVTWMVCLMTALIGCLAGCCLIPFCVDRFKSTTHRCPKCRTSICTLKTL